MLDQLYWTFIVEKVFYTLFSNLMLLFALATVVSRNPIHSILSLIGLFVVSSFMMVLVGAEFLAYVYIIVYVGAIAVLFLFIVMMVNVKSVPLFNGYDSNIFFLALVPIVVLTFMWEQDQIFARKTDHFLSIQRFGQPAYFYSDLDRFFELNPTVESFISSTKNVPQWRHPLKYLGPGLMEKLAISKNSPAIRAPVTFIEFYMTYSLFLAIRYHPLDNVYFLNSGGVSNIEAFGYVLYTHYFVVFLLSSIALFVAMIGAIVLTKYYGPEPIKKQYVSDFEEKSKKSSFKYKTPFF